MSERRYGRSVGRPGGAPENPEQCIESVYHNVGFGRLYQCSRKRGHGPEGLYCKQHAKKHEEKTNE